MSVGGCRLLRRKGQSFSSWCSCVHSIFCPHSTAAMVVRTAGTLRPFPAVLHPEVLVTTCQPWPGQRAGTAISQVVPGVPRLPGSHCQPPPPQCLVGIPVVVAGAFASLQGIGTGATEGWMVRGRCRVGAAPLLWPCLAQPSCSSRNQQSPQ